MWPSFSHHLLYLFNFNNTEQWQRAELVGFSSLGERGGIERGEAALRAAGGRDGAGQGMRRERGGCKEPMEADGAARLLLQCLQRPECGGCSCVEGSGMRGEADTDAGM